MSVVAVKVTKKEIIIGADSIRVSGSTQEKDKMAKLKQINGLVIGSSGTCEEASMFELYCKSRQPKMADEDSIMEFLSEFHEWLRRKVGKVDRLLENSYILVYKKKVFKIESYFIKEVKDYYAIGAGRDFALASLYLGNGIKESIQVSCELSIYCERPINIIKIAK